ncbi:hypothetical protein ENC20_04075 [Acinetobacter indicus]|nr:hypothetical protein ENC20_04075 [Acinetobacter indicus]
MTTNTSQNKLVETLIKRQDKKRLSLRFKKILSDAAASALIAACAFGFMAMSLKACDAEYENQINATKAHLEAMR